MGDDEVETETSQKALVFGSASFIGAALVETMRAAGYEVEVGHADSDVLAADVVVCNAYGKDTVSSPAPMDVVGSLLLTLRREFVQGELQNTERVLSKLVDADLPQPKSLILLSSVMTWARTPIEMVRLPMFSLILTASWLQVLAFVSGRRRRGCGKAGNF